MCLTGVHGIMEAQRDPGLKSIFADALLVAPDGMPTVWIGRSQGFSGMRRVFGPDLMFEIFARDEFRGCSHFLCGGEPGIAEKLKGRVAATLSADEDRGDLLPAVSDDDS